MGCQDNPESHPDGYPRKIRRSADPVISPESSVLIRLVVLFTPFFPQVYFMLSFFLHLLDCQQGAISCLARTNGWTSRTSPSCHSFVTLRLQYVMIQTGLVKTQSRTKSCLSSVICL